MKKFLKVVLLLLGAGYVVLQSLALELAGTALSSVILLLLIWLYIGWTEHKSKLFLAFLVTFTIAHVLSLISYSNSKFNLQLFESVNFSDKLYFVGNILFIMSYTFLIINLIRQLNLKKVFSELTIPIIVLVVLSVFCVTLISETTANKMSYYEYILEYTYTAVVMILLSIALINYMYRNNNKSMLFLLGSIFILFSEVIQLAYFYILSDNNLGFVYSFFLVVAFFFFYVQSQLQVTEPVPAYVDEPMDV